LLVATQRGLYTFDQNLQVKHKILNLPTTSVIFDRQGTGYVAVHDTIFKLSFTDSIQPDIKKILSQKGTLIYNLALDDKGLLLASGHTNMPNKAHSNNRDTISIWDTQTNKNLYNNIIFHHLDNDTSYGIGLKKNGEKLELMANRQHYTCSMMLNNNVENYNLSSAMLNRDCTIKENFLSWHWKRIDESFWVYLHHYRSIFIASDLQLESATFYKEAAIQRPDGKSGLPLFTLNKNLNKLAWREQDNITRTEELLVVDIRPVIARTLLRKKENNLHLIVPSLIAYGLRAYPKIPIILKSRSAQAN
jgi:hypothetical protein